MRRSLMAIMFCWIFTATAYAQFPDATTTGITATHCPNWAATKTNTSGRTLNTAGQTVNYEEITGQITVNAANVTLNCVKINANGNLYGLNCLTTNCANLNVTNTEIWGSSSANVILRGANGAWATVTRGNIRDGDKDNMKIRGNAALIDSYVHGFIIDPADHNDAIQIESGVNIDIRGNRIDGPFQSQTAAIIAKSDFGVINNLRLHGNRLSGGSFILYLVTGGFGPPTNVIVANNTFERNSWLHGDISSETNASHCLEWYGNVWHDGGARGVPTSASPQGSCAQGVFPPISGVTTAAPATFTPAPGTYVNSVTVSMATTETGATIRYTTDGSTPDGTDTAYTVPLVLSATTTLKAIVIKAGLQNSVVTTGVYTISTGGCTY